MFITSFTSIQLGQEYFRSVNVSVRVRVQQNPTLISFQSDVADENPGQGGNRPHFFPFSKGFQVLEALWRFSNCSQCSSMAV
jgi:hypothetical protein